MQEQIVITNLTKIISVVESISNGSLSSGNVTETYTIVTSLVTVVTKVVMKSYDADYYAALALITSVTNVNTFTTEETIIFAEIGN